MSLCYIISYHVRLKAGWIIVALSCLCNPLITVVHHPNTSLCYIISRQIEGGRAAAGWRCVAARRRGLLHYVILYYTILYYISLYVFIIYIYIYIYIYVYIYIYIYTYYVYIILYCIIL